MIIRKIIFVFLSLSLLFWYNFYCFEINSIIFFFIRIIYCIDDKKNQILKVSVCMCVWRGGLYFLRCLLLLFFYHICFLFLKIKGKYLLTKKVNEIVLKKLFFIEWIFPVFVLGLSGCDTDSKQLVDTNKDCERNYCCGIPGKISQL